MHHRRREPAPIGVRYDIRDAGIDRGNEGIGRPEIDPNDLVHHGQIVQDDGARRKARDRIAG
jgi:hypothetical protein